MRSPSCAARITATAIAVLVQTGCGGGGGKALCEKLVVCFGPDFDVEICQDQVLDDLSDRAYRPGVVDECAACVERNSCDDIESDACEVRCRGLTPLRALGEQ